MSICPTHAGAIIIVTRMVSRFFDLTQSKCHAILCHGRNGWRNIIIIKTQYCQGYGSQYGMTLKNGTRINADYDGGAVMIKQVRRYGKEEKEMDR